MTGQTSLSNASDLPRNYSQTKRKVKEPEADELTFELRDYKFIASVLSERNERIIFLIA